MLIDDTTLDRAAAAIEQAQGLLVLAGAGMGVDSGLPDFRGNQGFWNAYPPFRRRGLTFYDLANPVWFQQDPHQAWGFYGHRLELYRQTKPHLGFDRIQRWARRKPGGLFVFTSNVDCQFQAAGVDHHRILECHGSFTWLQCSRPCSRQTWPSGDVQIDVDPETFRAADPLPRCQKCGSVARPNILMFGDMAWIGDPCQEQSERFSDWLERLDRQRPWVALEIGAGSAVPTVRHQAESLARKPNCQLIRINPRESEGPSGTISIAAGGLAALTAIDQRIGEAEEARD